MARALEEKPGTGQWQSLAAFSSVKHESICTRCGGLMVSDFCMDLLNSTGELEFAAKRCVQCGEVVDAVIERNRRLRQEPMTDPLAERMFTNNRVAVGPY